MNERREGISDRATKVLQGYYTRSGDRILYHAVVQNVDTSENDRVLDGASRLTEGLTGVAESMAKTMDKRTRSFPTDKSAALQAWGESQLASDGASREAALQRAIKADANFGLAYVELAQNQLQQGDREGAAQVVAGAKQRLSMFSDLAQARLELLDATLSNRADERRTALRELTRLTTTDPSTIVALAELEFNRRSFDAAADLYRNALALEPENGAILNQLGYAEAYAGNLDGARSTLQRYRAAAPKQANPLDSLGEVHFFAGRFADAEKYFLEAQRLNPRFLGGTELLKAAQARLMQGDVGGADVLHGRYVQIRRAARDPAAEVESAQWLFITGRRKQGIDALASFTAAAGGDARAYAEAQLAVWRLEAGDGAEARRLASSAVHDAVSPKVAELASVCGMVAGAGESLKMPAGGAAEAEQVRQTALLYRLIFARSFGEGLQLLEKLYAQSIPGSDGDVRTLYAWALLETGRASEAATLVKLYPIPLGIRSDPLFESLVFPRFLAVRGVVLKSDADLRLFRKYAGDLPTVFKNPA